MLKHICRRYCRQHTGFITGIWAHSLHGRREDATSTTAHSKSEVHNNRLCSYPREILTLCIKKAVSFNAARKNKLR